MPMNYGPPDTSTPAAAQQPGTENSDLVRQPLQLVEKTNIAEELSEDELTKIGMDAKSGYEIDRKSRSQWEDDTADWLDLASQVRDKKTFPWDGAANVKYPLISTAAMQFAARAYPSLVPSDGKIVKGKIYGSDPTGEKAKKAGRVEKYMSYQLSNEMDYWEEDTDKLLMSVSVMGMMFRKTFWDSLEEKPASKLIYPDGLVVNYWSDRLEEAERVSEIMWLNSRQIKERVKKGLFLERDLGKPTAPQGSAQSVDDATVPYCIIEQHTWLDLDEDTLPEPYVVTFHRESGKVLRITARFTSDSIDVDEKGKPVRFEPLQYYTKYGFIPNPDGSFYDLGFGHLLGPLNDSVNTAINQLLDAGTLANLQAGFIGKGLRIKMGESRFSPGEWKVVNAVADDLKKQILPLPSKEPSPVIFQLLGMLIQSGKELASVAEIFTGKMPGQNTPATTTMATIEQGMKVFTAIYKRIYRSLEKEFKKLYRINKTFLSDEAYQTLLDEQAMVSVDFDEKGYDICPSADPTGSASTDRLMKAQALTELISLGTIDPMEATIRILQAQEQPEWEKLIPGMVQTGQPQPPQPPPDPKLLAIQAKAQTDAQKAQMDSQMKEKQMAMEQQGHVQDMQMKQAEHAQEMQHKQDMSQLEAQSKAQMNQVFMAEAQSKAAAGAMQHAQQLRQGEETHKSKMQMQKQAAKSSKAGSTTQSRKQSGKK